MTSFPRTRPTSIPAIHPVPEYLAGAALKARYEDMKRVIQVPWMGVVTMAYAHYPAFFDRLWGGLRPVCESSAYVETSRALRRHVEEAVARLSPPPIADRLSEIGYAPRELGNIRDMVEVFSHGNFAYLPMVAAVWLLLEGGVLHGEGAALPFDGRHAPEISVPFLLMEAHHADAPTRAVYEDIKAKLGLPFVNTDYRALARWPSYFSLAWNDLKPVVGTPAHEAICQDMHDRMLEGAAALPNPARLTCADLREAAQADASLDEVRAVCGLFQYLLPGLVTNVAFFRRQLVAP